MPLEKAVVSRYVTHGEEVKLAILVHNVLSSEISTSSDETVPVPEKLNERVYTPVRLCPFVGPLEKLITTSEVVSAILVSSTNNTVLSSLLGMLAITINKHIIDAVRTARMLTSHWP